MSCRCLDYSLERMNGDPRLRLTRAAERSDDLESATLGDAVTWDCSEALPNKFGDTAVENLRYDPTPAAR